MRLALPLIAFTFAVQSAAAQQPAQTVTAMGPGSLTLDEAVSLARRNNPVFRQTVNSRRAADADVRAARAALLPSVGASFGGRYQETGAQFIQGIRLENSSDIMQGNYSLNLNYNI